MPNGVSIMIKTLTAKHTCPTTKLVEGKMASQYWIAIHEDYKIKVRNGKDWRGLRIALDDIHGSYDESFQLMFNWKAEIESRSPGSIIDIELKKIGNDMHFSRMFVALKPCIDGFLNGCRPYVAVDFTFLTGRFKGQLASATSVVGHNWLYYVAFGVFESETEANWVWFFTNYYC